MSLLVLEVWGAQHPLFPHFTPLFSLWESNWVEYFKIWYSQLFKMLSYMSLLVLEVWDAQHPPSFTPFTPLFPHFTPLFSLWGNNWDEYFKSWYSHLFKMLSYISLLVLEVWGAQHPPFPPFTTLFHHFTPLFSLWGSNWVEYSKMLSYMSLLVLEVWGA